ncbi:small RNA degrading nuclease 1 [Mercurialis annua]|uniref:small RNA degrading nuclease 1 n=1 Tax=Mercurialis annua TaxID=3986 RepID=UPI00215FFD4A|nr:small RNA degrading nuclease 1 [Mercurialis annua]
MADKLADVPERVLVETVKLAQKQGRKGINGTWKEFLNVYDKKIGSSLSDPAKRPRDCLVSFLQTFTQKPDIEFVDRVLRLHFNHEVVDQIRKESPDDESAEQKLVRATIEHPYYLSKYAFPSYDQDWLVTKLPKKSKLASIDAIVAIDCEMVLCEDGTEALVKVCVVDRNLQVKLDEKVNPYKPVADYRSDITGITARDLDGVSCSLADVQKSMKKLLRKGTILVGHGLYNDLHALKIDHARVVDTSFIFRRSDGRPPSLGTLCKSVLGYELRQGGAPHNCIDDALAAMKLFLARIERGGDDDILVNQEDLLESELTKLFLHGIPTDVRSEELHGVFREQFTIELKPPKKGGSLYSALAIFENSQEANRAFEKLIGRLEKDKNGLPQKMILLKRKTGATVNLFVRKVGHDHLLLQDLQKKRAFEGEDTSDPKKLKREDCEDHLKEIEKLKQDLIWKDVQIAKQEKMIKLLTKELEGKKTAKKKK